VDRRRDHILFGFRNELTTKIETARMIKGADSILRLEWNFISSEYIDQLLISGGPGPLAKP
jgi:hypothetical protein